MVTAFYTGSFDPLTNGHIFIIKNSLKLCDRLVIGIGRHFTKQAFFSHEERLALLEQVLKRKFPEKIGAIELLSFETLAVEAAKKIKADFFIRGIRNEEDMGYEMRMAKRNNLLAPDLPTIFISSYGATSLCASSFVKEVAQYGGDIAAFVPKEVEEALINKMQQ